MNLLQSMCEASAMCLIKKSIVFKFNKPFSTYAPFRTLRTTSFKCNFRFTSQLNPSFYSQLHKIQPLAKLIFLLPLYVDLVGNFSSKRGEFC